MKLLKGKKAIVTGAARGIGRAIAEEFYYQGADIVIADIDEETGRQGVEDIRASRSGKKEGNRILFKKIDITSAESVENVFNEAVGELGFIDILVNNAAIIITKDVKDFPVEDFRKVLNVNMMGTFICSQIAVKHMIKEGIKGSILNISAASSRKADRGHAAYSASKAAIVEFARVLALEVGAYGIRVNSILPGATETDMLKDVFEKVEGIREDIINKTVLGKLGQPKDQANAAVFLCSDMASHITGEYLIVSGGEFFNP